MTITIPTVTLPVWVLTGLVFAVIAGVIDFGIIRHWKGMLSSFRGKQAHRIILNGLLIGAVVVCLGLAFNVQNLAYAGGIAVVYFMLPALAYICYCPNR